MRLLLAMSLALSSCGTMDSSPPSSSQTPPRPASPGNEVRHAGDLEAKNASMVDVFGTYEHVSVAKRPDQPPDGHAAVRLDDGTRIHLSPPWDPEAKRPPDEIAKYDGQSVVVKGLLMKECPPPPDQRAYAKVPCLYKGGVVMDPRTYKALMTGELE